MEFEICWNCDGNGKGYYDGTLCYICHGTCAVGRSSDIAPDENIDDGDGGTESLRGKMKYDDEDGPEMESVICGNCSGSGEGMYDGSTCSTCNSSGEVLREVDQVEVDSSCE